MDLELVHISPEAAVVIWNGVPYIVPLRHIRKHMDSIRAAFTTCSRIYASTSSSPSGVTSEVFDLAPLISLLELVEGSVSSKTMLVGTVVDYKGVVKGRGWQEPLDGKLF